MNLTDALQSDLIRLPLHSATKVAVIKELLGLLAEKRSVHNVDEILESVLEREKIMTTGVGNGVAIPHCKTDHIGDFMITLGIHPQGVDFQSLDNQPAKIIFLLIGPESKPGTHIRLLSRISRIIAKEDVRENILSCQSSDEIYEYLHEQETQFFEMNP